MSIRHLTAIDCFNVKTIMNKPEFLEPKHLQRQSSTEVTKKASLVPISVYDLIESNSKEWYLRVDDEYCGAGDVWVSKEDCRLELACCRIICSDEQREVIRTAIQSLHDMNTEINQENTKTLTEEYYGEYL